MKRNVYSTGLKVLLIIAIAIGVGFHLINLDRKIYWHDEAYTSMRAAGYTRLEIDNAFFQNHFLTISDLQKFQQIKPDSTVADTIHSLITEDPQHPPLYFVMARGWMQLFGSSILASRLLPVLLSLLGLPLMYGLALELFESHLVAWLATAFLALSPFDILFAQTARQYSFLTTAVILSSWLLLRAIRLSHWRHWVGYALSLAMGLYIHPFFTLTIAAQGAYVLLLTVLDQSSLNPFSEQSMSKKARSAQVGLSRRSFSHFFSFGYWQQLIYFFSVVVLALALYSPWIAVLSVNMQRASSTTDWTRTPTGIDYLAKLWTLSFTSSFVDIDFGFENPFTFLFRFPYILLIIAAVYGICRRTPKFVWLFILTSVLVPFLMLVLPDLILGGKRSAVSRYLISCYPAIQLAVAYWLAVGLSSGKQRWRWILGILLTSSIASSWISTQATSWWNKDLSYFNADVIQIVNGSAAQSPTVLLSDIGNDYTNTGDLLSLSYNLDDRVRAYLVSQSPDLQPLTLPLLTDESSVIAFRASDVLQAAIERNNWQLEAIDYQPVPNFSRDARLWKVQR